MHTTNPSLDELDHAGVREDVATLATADRLFVRRNHGHADDIHRWIRGTDVGGACRLHLLDEALRGSLVCARNEQRDDDRDPHTSRILWTGVAWPRVFQTRHRLRTAIRERRHAATLAFEVDVEEPLLVRQPCDARDQIRRGALRARL